MIGNDWVLRILMLIFVVSTLVTSAFVVKAAQDAEVAARNAEHNAEVLADQQKVLSDLLVQNRRVLVVNQRLLEELQNPAADTLAVSCRTRADLRLLELAECRDRQP